MSPPPASTVENDEPNGSEFPSGHSSGRILYRAMCEDSAGGPMIEPTARTLGIRPNVDIIMAVGMVWPNRGGMSVAPDDPNTLHPLRKPPAYGGLGKDPICSITIVALGDDLQFRQDSSTHGLIEPSHAMRIYDLQKALEATKPY